MNRNNPICEGTKSGSIAGKSTALQPIQTEPIQTETETNGYPARDQGMSSEGAVVVSHGQRSMGRERDAHRAAIFLWWQWSIIGNGEVGKDGMGWIIWIIGYNKIKSKILMCDYDVILV